MLRRHILPVHVYEAPELKKRLERMQSVRNAEKLKLIWLLVMLL